ILAFLCFLLLPGIEVGYEKLGHYLASSVGGLRRLIATAPAPIHVFHVTWDRSISLTSSVFRVTQSAALPDSAAVILVLLLFGGALALVVAALSLPFSIIGLAHQRTNWRAFGGASWCVLILVLVTVWTGTRSIGDKGQNKMPDFRP